MHIKQELWLQGLKAGRVMRFRPLGGSMIPCLRQGDIVSISPGQGCRVGDIVLWQAGEAMVLHRVLIKKNGRIVSKGDALRHLDAPVMREQIVGTAVLRERRGRVRRLDRLGARFLGLSFCLTSACVPKLMKILSALKRLGEQSWAWLSNRNENCISSWLLKIWPGS